MDANMKEETESKLRYSRLPPQMRNALFWVITQRVVVIPYRHFWLEIASTR
jgi:hypothetical protein